MSGSGPKILGASTSATGVALLPNTAGSKVLFLIAMTAVGIGLVTLVITGVISLKQRSSRV